MALYNYYAVTSGKLCPVGWHVPDIDEWYTLIIFLGMIQQVENERDRNPQLVKSQYGATNESGFNGLPGGFRNAYYKDFQAFRSTGFFWSSQAGSAMGITYQSVDVTHGSMSMANGLSVRCIKD
jgi:uncharacterized protein (TIGR02145 family)